MVEKKQYKVTINFNPEQWKWFCEEMLGLAPNQEPERGVSAEYFQTGGSLLGMPEGKTGHKFPSGDENPKRKSHA